MNQSFPLKVGKQPPQPGVIGGMNTEEMLLYGAWLHGMTVDDVVHRMALFSFVQTHIANKSDESLQNAIQKKSYWEATGDGFYALIPSGLQKIKVKFGEPQSRKEFGYKYSFYRDYAGHEIAIIADVVNRKLLSQIDGISLTGGAATDFLEELGVTLPKEGTSLPRKVLDWIVLGNDYHWEIRYPAVREVIANTKQQNATPPFLDTNDDEDSFPEGKDIYKLHRTKERNKTVISLAKDRALKRDELLHCEICNFSFIEKYGEIGQGFIEGHHTKPLSELTEQTETRVEDIALVCSNCHRMLHRRRPWLSMEDLKALLK